ncbi:hypothetical protein NL676_002021 [Syzygium grande]|nr:hypothetical protein NL676_002021 [Syzygium grande]
MPSVLSSRNSIGFTERAASPVLEKLVAKFFMLKKMKSSVVTSEEFLRGRTENLAVRPVPNLGFGMQ